MNADLSPVTKSAPSTKRPLKKRVQTGSETVMTAAKNKTRKLNCCLKVTQVLIALTMFSLLTGCATCHPQPHDPGPISVEQSPPKMTWTDWLIEQIVNNAVSCAIWR